MSPPRLSLGRKLLLSHVLVLGPLLLLVWAASLWRTTALEDTSRLTARHVKDLRDALVLEKTLHEADDLLNRYLLTRDPYWRREALSRGAEFERILRAEMAEESPAGGAETVATGPQARILVEVHDAYRNDYAPLFFRLLDSEAVEAGEVGRAGRGSERLLQVLQQYVRFHEGGIEAGRQALDRSIVRSGALLLAGAAVALALAIGTSVVMSWLLVRPVRHLLSVALAYKAGDIAARPMVLPDDEIGDLGRAFGQALSQISEQQQNLLVLSYTDPLTGLYNRRRLDEILRQMQPADAPVAFAMIDIDHFKAYNDRRGHVAGDEVLRRLGALLRRSLRPIDIAARYGGEEFCVLLLDDAGEGAEGAWQAMERFRRAFERHPFSGEESLPGGRLTLSAGVSLWNGEGPPLEALRRADEALYRAKGAGRNRVEVSPASPPPGDASPPHP